MSPYQKFLYVVFLTFLPNGGFYLPDVNFFLEFEFKELNLNWWLLLKKLAISISLRTFPRALFGVRS